MIPARRGRRAEYQLDLKAPGLLVRRGRGPTGRPAGRGPVAAASLAPAAGSAAAAKALNLTETDSEICPRRGPGPGRGIRA